MTTASLPLVPENPGYNERKGVPTPIKLLVPVGALIGLKIAGVIPDNIIGDAINALKGGGETIMSVLDSGVDTIQAGVPDAQTEISKVIETGADRFTIGNVGEPIISNEVKPNPITSLEDFAGSKSPNPPQ